MDSFLGCRLFRTEEAFLRAAGLVRGADGEMLLDDLLLFRRGTPCPGSNGR